MKVLRIALAVAIVSSGFVVAGAATAHNPDVIRPAKAGPIMREETTLAELRDWFGRPTVRRTMTVACSRVTKARWGRRLQVFAWRDEDRHVSLGGLPHGGLWLSLFDG